MLIPLFGAFWVYESRFRPSFNSSSTGSDIHPVGFRIGNVDIHEGSSVDAEQELSVHGYGTHIGSEFVLASSGNVDRVIEQLWAAAAQAVVHLYSAIYAFHESYLLTVLR